MLKKYKRGTLSILLTVLLLLCISLSAFAEEEEGDASDVQGQDTINLLTGQKTDDDGEGQDPIIIPLDCQGFGSDPNPQPENNPQPEKSPQPEQKKSPLWNRSPTPFAFLTIMAQSLTFL